MAPAVDAAIVRQYSNNILLLTQQLLPKLRPTVYLKPNCEGEMVFQDQLAAEDAEEKTARNQDVVNSNPEFSRRKITPRYFYKAPLVDSMDKVYMAKDPTSEIVQNNGAALARAQDTVIGAAFFATMYGGKEGTDTFTLPTAQKIAVGSAGLTITKLRAASQILNSKEVPQEGRYLAHSSKQLQDLLTATEVTSADTNTIKALVDGKVSGFMGFTFAMTERMPISSTTRQCAAYHRTGMCLAIWKDMVASIDILPGKHFSAQVYAGQSYGAARLEEEKVVEIDCYEA